MDAIELSRKRAAELHVKAVAAGRDPCKPYEFAVAEAEAREIWVERCAKGASQLDGARAIYNPEYQQILHEDVGSQFEQAFLVAHEIGHAELGDGDLAVSSYPVEIDSTRTAESSPVGMERVVDYSRRQRREVQMDLFAREFLLPREYVKALHLQGGMTCTEIANKLGAPFEVVAQQMLDALLLPSVPFEEMEPPSDIPLNSEQSIASKHRGGAFLLQAGPGTGKTRTLIERVEGLLDEGVDPKRILLLTFSNKAAAEMGERIATKRPKEATALWIGTFHGFGLDILRRFNNLCGLPSDPKLLDRAEAVELIENEFLRLDLTHYRNLYDPSQIAAEMLRTISRAKDEVVDSAQYMSLAQQMAARANGPLEIEAAEKATEVARVYCFYESIKALSGCVDFGDLVMQPVLLLERNEAVRQQLEECYDHVLVDEYQDVNRSSIRLLTLIRPDGRNLWAVGDAKQSIYRFRGASSFNISRFGVEDFSGGITRSLEINYRSTPEIVNSFSEFASSMAAGQTGGKLKANRLSSGNTAKIHTVTEGSLVSSALAESIQEHRSAGFAFRDQAVLSRGNDTLSKLAKELESLGIPVLYLGSLFERAEIRDLVAMLSLLVDRRAMGLLRTLGWPQFAMSMEDTVLVFGYLRNSDSEPRAWMSNSIPGLSIEGTLALQRLRTALQGFDESSNPWQVLARVLLDTTRTAADISRSCTVVDQAKGIAIWQFMNFARVQPSGQGLPITRLMERMRRLVRLGDERDLRQLPAAAQRIDAVRLMTIHGAKGLEFPVVHLTGCNQGSIPGTYRSASCCPPDGMIAGGQGLSSVVERSAHDEEQECLFYVAMSRAKDRLLFYAATATSNGSRRNLSPFLERLGPIPKKSITPSLVLPASDDQLSIAVSFSGTPRFGSEAIALYDSCGRRFLYTHLLQIGGRRRMTAFMQMHEAIREVYKAVVAAQNLADSDWETRLEQEFVKHGLHEHGYSNDYRDIAKTMLKYFIDSRAGARFEPPTALQVSFGNGHVEVRPDEILIRDGVRTLRRVKTGHGRSADQKDVNAAAFLLAARKHFPDATVELVYLADAKSTPLSLTAKVLSNQQTKMADLLLNIHAGRFEAVRSEFTCPGCPAFFVCGPTPVGTLKKEF